MFTKEELRVEIRATERRILWIVLACLVVSGIAFVLGHPAMGVVFFTIAGSMAVGTHLFATTMLRFPKG